jgi:hypothetical protein
VITASAAAITHSTLSSATAKTSATTTMPAAASRGVEGEGALATVLGGAGGRASGGSGVAVAEKRRPEASTKQPTRSGSGGAAVAEWR